MKYLTLLVALLLAGCMTREERIAAQSAKDDQKCLSYGAQIGSAAYVNCRAQLDAARTTADAIEDAAPTANPCLGCAQVAAHDDPRSPLHIAGMLTCASCLFRF